MPSQLPKLDIPKTDAIVVGSGPNGLAAAIRLAQAGRSVVVLESADTPGGGVRSAELTLPGFVHDICSSVYPMVVCSPFFRTLPLKSHGLEWIFSPASLAHPFDDGTALFLYQSMEETISYLGQDGAGYRRLFGKLVPRWQDLLQDVFAPFGFPKHPLLFAGFSRNAIRSGEALARAFFRTDHARTLIAGMAAHSMLPLETLSTAAAVLVLTLGAHAGGWPIIRGGAQQLTTALASYLRLLGGQLITGCHVESLDQLPQGQTLLLDVTPRQLVKMAGSRLPNSYRHKLERYRYGVAAFKIDWALHQPVPWRAPECRKAVTVHLGGSLDEICESERCPWRGEIAERPFVLFAQPSLFDPTRAPAGKHTAWAYCHVPHGYAGNLAEVVLRIEKQVERFAPGFIDSIAYRAVMGPEALERHNPNLVGGDIAGGAPFLSQLLLRPTASLYRTPLPRTFLCSSSTPPGPGVHGMCGYFAAEAALKVS